MSLMIRARRRSAVLVTTLLVAGGLAVPLAVPADALTVPDWTTGHVPWGEGCAVTSLTTAPPVRITFSDTGFPDILGWSINGSTTAAVLVPGTQTLSFAVRSVENCSGTLRAQPVITFRNLKDGEGYVNPAAETPLTTNPFDLLLAWQFSGGPEYAGEYRIPAVRAARRYDSVSVTVRDYALFNATPSLGVLSPFRSGPWSAQRTYLLLKTTVAASSSRSSIKAGKKVTVRATLNKAGATTYVPAAGSKIALQTRIGKRAWVTRTVVTVPSTGAVSYTFSSKKSVSWRWVHSGERSTLFTAPVSSPVKKIKVR